MDAITPPSIKERPIIFSAAMVRAILEGRKIQTRRVLKNWGKLRLEMNGPEAINADLFDECPYGHSGDRLWVKEAIRVDSPFGDGSTGSIFVADNAPTKADAWPWQRDTLPSMFMPYGLRRITLEIVSVRVERLQKISQADAMAEGCKQLRDHSFVFDGTGYDRAKLCHGSPQIAFGCLWDEIHGSDSWEANPWVWMVEFKRVDA